MSSPHEVNIEITPTLMQYAKDDGYELGIGLSRVRTIYGESYKEWFLICDANIDDVIKTFTQHDPALRHTGPAPGVHTEQIERIRNGDPRLFIDLKPFERNDLHGTGITVYYRPVRSSYERW